MKKSALVVICLSTTLFLTGCGVSKSSQALNSLSTQLDKVQSVVSSTNTNEVMEVSPNLSFDANSTYSSLQNFRANSYQNMQREEAIRQDILSLNSHLKSYTKTKYKLSKSKANAIINLSNNIDRYLDNLNNTKPSVKSNVRKIQKNLKNDKNMNFENAQSYYISLNNNMNERYAYMSNIYSNLEQIYNILGCLDGCDSNNQIQIDEQRQTTTDKTTKEKNIDTYGSQQTATENINTTINQPPPEAINNNQPPYSQYYNGNYYQRGRFNPNRNTDTFYPRLRNIDTYRINPNAYYNYNHTYAEEVLDQEVDHSNDIVKCY